MLKKTIDENDNVYSVKKPIYKRRWFIILIVVLGIAIFAPKEKDGHTNKEITSSSKVSKQDVKIKSNKEEKKSYDMKEIVPVDNVIYRVNAKSSMKRINNKYLGKKNADGIYLVLNISIKNNGNKALTVSNNLFKLLKGKVVYSPDSEACLYVNEEDKLFDHKVNPGNAVTGNIVFDVPDEVINDACVQLQVKAGILGFKKVNINLQ